MTREETKSILNIIIRAYPRMKIVETKEDVDLWHECLEDLEYQMARKAAINLVKETKDFPPDIATIREEYKRLYDEYKKADAAIVTHYDQMRSTYGGDGEIREYLELFRERCGNTVEGADRLHKAMDAFVNSCTYTYTPYLDDAIRCIDIQTHTIPMEIMELMQENKRKSRLPEEVIRKHSKMVPSKSVDER